MNKTRKIRNKKIFLKWLKKSHRNKYNIVHGGEGNDDNQDDSRDKLSKEISFADKLINKENAVFLAGAVTLSELAVRLASNPVVVSAVMGLGVGSLSLGIASTGGALLVMLLVGTYAFVKIRALYNNYYTMIYVMNDYIILLKKIDTMVRVSIKISQEYKFVIDTRDVIMSLQRIFNKFDKLLSKKNIVEINDNVIKNSDEANNVLTTTANDATIENNIVADIEAGNQDDTEREILLKPDVTTRTNEIKEKKESMVKRMKTKFSTSFKNFKNVLRLNSKEFTEDLNEEVTRLGLYFSVLLGELNITLNVCQMDIISKRNFSELMRKNNSVKSDENFNKMLISSIIYRTLQLYNIFNLCDTIRPNSDTSKKTCSEENMNEYVREIEHERGKIVKVLFGKSSDNRLALFPLYAPQTEATEAPDTNSDLQNLIEIMKNYTNKTINSREEAKVFLDIIYKFNDAPRNSPSVSKA